MTATLQDIIVPVGVKSSLVGIWTAEAVNWIVVWMPEHPPHARIQPRTEQE